MKPFKILPLLALISGAALFPGTRALAEDTKGKWQFGFGLSYMATVDYIRSNADLAIAETARQPDGTLSAVGSVDERPDINILNQPSIRDNFKVDFNASYGLTRWLAVEAAASYLKAPVGNIEFYFRNEHQGLTGQPTNTLVASCGPGLAVDAAHPGGNAQPCWTYTSNLPDEIKQNTFLPVGELTEIPIHLSGLIRFRPESPFDPYFGAGIGYILTNLKTGDEFNRKAADIAALKVSIASEGEFTTNNRCNRVDFPIGVECTNFKPGPLEASIKNAFEFHAVGGVDYYVSDRFSVYMDARYIWTQGAVDIRTDDAHQVRFAVLDEGQLLTETIVQTAPGQYGPGTFKAGDPSTWYLWEDIGVPANAAFHRMCPQCQGDGFLETEDKNQNGLLDERCLPNVANDFCEDEGWLYKLPPGSRDVDESLRMLCPDNINNATGAPGADGIPDCAHNRLLDTEDANGNGWLDRYLVYGIDICTTTRGNGNPVCAGRQVADDSHINYVWPEGAVAGSPPFCVQRPDQLGPYSQLQESGCPPFPRDSNGNLAVVGNTAADNAADTYLIQGGRIRMGGFSLGMGFKFTF